MAAQPRVRFYREFLTPALHRRFTSAAALTLLVCYAEAVIVGDKSSFLWSWFPLGPAGLRALMISISNLIIFVLRVAQLHFGARTAKSPLQDFIHHLTSFNTARTFAFYTFSAWWFGEVCIWSASGDKSLAFVNEGKSYERPQLNERPVYLRCFVLILAIVQSLVHLWLDLGRVHIPSGSTSSSIAPPIQQLKKLIPLTLKTAFVLALVTGLTGPIVYILCVRWVAWRWSLFLARLVWSIPQGPKPSILPLLSPFLLVRSVTLGLLLLCLWGITNATFSAYVAQEPLKRGHPLTDDSRDPNGSLLDGLRSKKEPTRTFAFWELLHISQRFDIRRKSIFTELDRAGGSTWTQVLSITLEKVQLINARISNFQQPPPAAPVLGQEVEVQIETLPRISSPLRQESVLTRPPPPSWASSAAKSLGQSGSSPNATSPRAKQYLNTARHKLLKQLPEAAVPKGSISSLYDRILQSHLGFLLQQTFARRVNTILFDSPYSDLYQIVNAIDSVSSLTTASLKEDQFGTVSKDIPKVIRTFVSTSNAVQAFVQGLPPHWTDVDFQDSDGGGRSIKEVELVSEHLKAGLKQVTEAFGDYAVDLGLGFGEMREAKRIAGM